MLNLGWDDCKLLHKKIEKKKGEKKRHWLQMMVEHEIFQCNRFFPQWETIVWISLDFLQYYVECRV